MLRRYALFVIILALSLVIAASTHNSSLKAESTPSAFGGDNNPPAQIKFSHKLHITDVGAECSACHPAAATSKLSSDNLRSAHDQCATCHEEQVGNNCDFCHTNPENITPRPAPTREVLFSHQQHLAMEGVACQTCHAGLETVELSTVQNMPTMTTCTTCHNNRKATNTCESCHTNFVTLIPPDHQRADFKKNHRDLARLGALDAACQTCHTETFCQQCHQTSGLKAFGKGKDLMTEPDPKRSTKDSPTRMNLQNVHELNYRFTHGIDARARAADCASCHDAQTFCAQCHEAGGNITQGKFKPRSHMVPGFTTLGRGSGGGLHAEEARRDIESCISCHDVEGKDPTCMMCHTETGRIR
jgi:c(7)-type cytochrome triheme protein